ncbi:MAG: phenylalanine--tRNA ligase subunit alpha [Candidatus Cloacimonetes bacterium]|nr:phenylalanine--tRNA ligase subunit alpha [Candidatus Cloacimonadota bacterium]
MENNLTELIAQATQDIGNCTTLSDLANIKARYLGKKSVLVEQYARMKDITPQDKPAFGNSLNQSKTALEQLFSDKETELKHKSWSQNKDAVSDLTLPGVIPAQGSLHPLTIVLREIEDVFMSMGFEVAEGFDIEDEYHNFDALNTPSDHPSRNLADTFYLKDGNLLRTQTSTVQVRVMENYPPPIKIISPGRCYRNDKADASHSPVFHQVEALVVDEKISLADLKDTLQIFAERMFGSKVKTRIRPHFFPFTEPSAEMDMSCVMCGGSGCKVCKQSGWLELGGAGMVDPNVFDMLKIDSEKYSGFAFGLGIDRIAMMKFDIPDLRILFENDLRFLRQFR